MNSQAVWQGVLGEIELSIPSSSFNAWFKNTELADISDGLAVVMVPNIFVKAQLEKKYHDQIVKCLQKGGVDQPSVEYRIKSSTKKPISREADELIKSSQETKVVSSSPKRSSNGLNPKYTFDNFIVGSSNDLANAACQAVADNPGNKYNPLYLYGGAGLGKTHLMQAIGNEIVERNPKKRVLYITTDTFVKEFLDSIRFKKKDFSDKYRNVDVLIVDDMQFIAGKEKTQDEFFHTFNDLHQNNKQIIISSDKPPKSIPTLTDRLRSRFEWGMAIDIQMPDFETRCAIVKSKASFSGFELESDVIEYLANNFKTNIRELEGALNRLLAYAEMQNFTPDIESAEGILGDIKKVRPHHITPKQVIDKTARYFSVDVKDICSARRDKYIMTPRQIAMYLLRSELKMSYPKIAQELGRKDHTTAIHSVEKITKESAINLTVREQINELRDRLYV
ncbi:chromosomal replication initiator protein DnaA [Candidatus Saccharibacteria bacterium]|nr:MAG: chromosomal replication initiator protein DnaA [Candidatus Saccharibacteria bacterium]